MKTPTRWLITGAACLLLVSGLGLYKYLQIQAMIAYGKSFPEPSESVEAVEARVQRLPQTVTSIGEIVAPLSLQLRSEVAGRIAAVKAVPGARVKQGDLLVQLDVSEEQARLQAAQARVNLARVDLDRVKRLSKQKTVSEETVDQAEANFAIAQADVMALQAIIAKKSLRAPFDAIVGLHEFEVGEYLKSDTEIVTLLGITDYHWVDFHLPVSQAQVQIGSRVEVELPGVAESRSAEVIARDSVASASSRNVTLRARLDGDLPVPVNSVVRVKVELGSIEAVTVPRTALSFEPQRTYVYVLEPDSEHTDAWRARQRTVLVGERGEESVTVVSGLRAGELVAARGSFKLLPDILTYVRERPQPGQAAKVEGAAP
ncbi:efflux RND transporter periplasmic adaptor subunit [Pseudomaricurvus sp. HS19]|uniref:efflux RND transporter periplasmic adaptor subunit n=1 Tax=Pseudomaricurvus sp. HS19 TaxID=2692626 RepID=UPI00136857B8|nr:efflux RND transporter periplasmic adaptor subunit [Pseudomaricurvus sp. HS19]MYM62163.1 efflux RND transporter periplasmic adaptor subunit [Pseudomaricurvus sp. HS19]